MNYNIVNKIIEINFKNKDKKHDEVKELTKNERTEYSQSDFRNDVTDEESFKTVCGRQWKKNLAKFDAAAFGKSVATGEFFAAHGYAENIYGELDEAEYENFDYFIPKGSMMYIDSMAIVKGSPNLENAYKFLEFLYRPENFIRVYEQFKAPSIIKGIEEKSSIKSIVKSSQVIENAKLPGSLSEKAKEKHDKIWNENSLPFSIVFLFLNFHLGRTPLFHIPMVHIFYNL